jgi:VIT1/CCC1 family predicted Fe2+/Mn2+ transporter
LAQIPNLPQQLTSIQVIVRFGLRMIILVFFATLGSIGFGRSLAALLWMSTILGAVIATIRREPPFDKVLNHWDETVAYAALCCLASGFNQVASF